MLIIAYPVHQFAFLAALIAKEMRYFTPATVNARE